MALHALSLLNLRLVTRAMPPLLANVCSLLLGMFPNSAPSFRLDEEASFASSQRNLRQRHSSLMPTAALAAASAAGGTDGERHPAEAAAAAAALLKKGITSQRAL